MKPAVVAPNSLSSSRESDGSILLIEDDPSVAEIVRTALAGRGFDVTVSATGASALDAAASTPPDIVVLDLGLPDIDGVDVCRHLRQWYPNPIIVLSAEGSEERKIAALEEGADDFVTKPFSMGELLARVNVALRHQRALSTVVDPGVCTVGDVVIDGAARRVSIGGEPVELTRKEFSLLALLAHNAGKLVTHDMLLRGVWGAAAAGTTASLRVHVTQLRKKLGTGANRPQLVTEPGTGYRLVPRDP